ncbi:MAG: nucleotidyltransferase domain-containing protein [Actinomycetota bacterium]|nr:nucleotidyltransferase domain-containing protein [Actinomycetota bacterium]
MDAADVVREPDVVAGALRAAGSRFAFMHGSRVSATARADSDLDVAAWFGGAIPALAAGLDQPGVRADPPPWLTPPGS